jgi:hypothetical protein
MNLATLSLLFAAVFAWPAVLLGRAIYLAFYSARSFYRRIVPPKPLGGRYLARAAAWICGRRRSRKKRWYAILPIITVVFNAALVGRAYSSRFLGACLDTAATSSCGGIAQAKALCNLTSAEWKLEPSTRKFRFGDILSEPLGILTVPLTTPAGILNLRLHVVKEDVPLLIGSDVLYAELWYVRTPGPTCMRKRIVAANVSLPMPLLAPTWFSTDIANDVYQDADIPSSSTCPTSWCGQDVRAFEEST